MPFWTTTRVGPRNYVLNGVQIPQREGAIFGVVQTIQKHWQFAVAFAAKGIIQSPIMLYSGCNYSVLQASASRNPENLIAGDAA